MIMEVEKSHSSPAGHPEKPVVPFKGLWASTVDSILDLKAWDPGAWGWEEMDVPAQKGRELSLPFLPFCPIQTPYGLDDWQLPY